MKRSIPLYSLRLVKDRTIRLSDSAIQEENAAARTIRDLIADRPQEHLVCLFLNGCNVVTGATIVGIGSIHGIGGVSIADVLRAAIAAGVSAIVIGHNHPSNDPTPSVQDIAFTRKLVEACKIVDIQLVDHVVVSRAGHYSMASHNVGGL